MRSRSLQAVVVLSFAAAPLVLASTVASAADSVLGETFANSAPCGGSSYVELQTASPSSSSFTVASNGVITSVRMTGAPTVSAIRAFKLARPAITNYTIVGSTNPVTIPSGQTSSEAVRIPTRAGDVLGQYVGDGTSCARPASASFGYSVYLGNPGVGENSGVASTATGYEIPVAATVEPDADGDGFGDTTQDRCPTQASTQGLCNFSLGGLGQPSGKAKVGKTLTAPAVTLPAGSTEHFQWYRTFKNNKHKTVTRAIGGAVSSTYKLKSKDRGKKVLVAVTASAPTYNPATVSSLPKRVH